MLVVYSINTCKPLGNSQEAHRTMYKQNKAHQQKSLFGLAGLLPQDKLDHLHQSWGWVFYELIFQRIDEERFRPLYCSNNGRPNAPVNCLVSALVLQHYKGWTVEEMIERTRFDLVVRAALGLDMLNDDPFCAATYFNFCSRLHEHHLETGENLLESVFDSLTSEQLERLGVKSDIQRCDSFQALSNISQYTRVRLLVEVLLRLVNVIEETDRSELAEMLAPYTADTSQQFVYSLNRDDVPRQLDRLGEVYMHVHGALKDRYAETTAFQVFERVYAEQFAVADERVEIRPTEELHSGMVQSPDDLDATYRNKRGESFRGQVASITETANPDNDVNLITDVATAANNTDDGAILNKRLDIIKIKTPDLKELHTDGGYGSVPNDEKMGALGVTHVQTAVRGRKAAVPMRIEARAEEGSYNVSCPRATVCSEPFKKKYRAVFPAAACEDCPHAAKCQAGKRKAGHRVFTFDDEAARVNARNHSLESIPPERRKVRPNVEATMKEFTAPFNHKGKLKVRGAFSTTVVVLAVAIGVNFGRIQRASQNSKSPPCRRSLQSPPAPQAAGTGPPGGPQACQPTSAPPSSTASNGEGLPCPETEKSPISPLKDPRKTTEEAEERPPCDRIKARIYSHITAYLIFRSHMAIIGPDRDFQPLLAA